MMELMGFPKRLSEHHIQFYLVLKMSFSGPKLKKFLLRYCPPGIILQYEREGVMKQKPIDLLDLTPDVDIEVSPQRFYKSLRLSN